MTAKDRFVNYVDEVLHYVWDPLGVAGIPEVRDEYRGYVPRVVELAMEGNVASLKEYLHWVETRTMGVSGDPGQCEEVASIIFSWKEALLKGS
jgi:hypothetical protein